MADNLKYAVLIPCYNEEKTVSDVINDFRKELPEAGIYVYDNNSRDNTVAIALANGAKVRKEFKQGKGNVVKSMFRDIDADIYILVDGDNTYPASAVRELIKPVVEENIDMAIGDRLTNESYFKENKRRFHNFGNNLVRGLINKLFSSSLKDIMSGFRVFNRNFVKNLPVLSEGFEIETEMTLHALDKSFKIKEIPIKYSDRPEGSFSKLNTFRDGFKVLKTIFWIFKDYRPFMFFSILSLMFFILGILFGLYPIYEYITYQYVYRVPSAILATGLMIFAMVFFAIGLILDTVNKYHKLDYTLRINHFIHNQRR